jgi:hypothetical protein
MVLHNLAGLESHEQNLICFQGRNISLENNNLLLQFGRYDDLNVLNHHEHARVQGVKPFLTSSAQQTNRDCSLALLGSCGTFCSAETSRQHRIAGMNLCPHFESAAKERFNLLNGKYVLRK